LVLVLPQFCAIYKCDMKDIPKESAQQRATRIWNNARIQRSTIKPIYDTNHDAAEYLKNHEAQLNRTLSKFNKELREIMLNNAKENIRNYRDALKAQHITLLKEKLRRLQLKEQENE
jgi:hypothetical protein